MLNFVFALVAYKPSRVLLLQYFDKKFLIELLLLLFQLNKLFACIFISVSNLLRNLFQT